MIKKLLSFLIIGGLFSFLLFNIFKNWPEISSYSWRFEPNNIILMISLIIPLYFLNVLAWHLITQALGVNISFSRNMRVWMISNLSRFLPGGIWQYPGRVYLLSKEGPTVATATTAVIIEMLFNLLIATLIVITMITFWQFPTTFQGTPIIIVFFLLIISGFFILTNSKIMTYCAFFIKRITGKGEILKKINLPLSKLSLISLIFLLQNFFAGGALFFLSRGAISLPIEELLSFIGIFSSSWLLGYITLFAPSGLGVQETSMAAMLGNYMPLAIAAVIAIFFRSMLLMSEFLSLLLILLLCRFNNRLKV